MIPFVILLAFLWLVVELLDATLAGSSGPVRVPTPAPASTSTP